MAFKLSALALFHSFFKGKIILMGGLWIFELIGRLFLYESITHVADRTQPLLTHFILIPPGTTQPNTIKQSAQEKMPNA